MKTRTQIPAASLLTGFNAPAADFYVAPTGNDDRFEPFEVHVYRLKP